MNIYLFEINRKTASTTMWIAATGFFIWVCLSMFTSFADEVMLKILDDFPEAFKRAFGLEHDFSSILGYYSFIATFLYLCGAIYACNLGLTTASVEESELTADFLLTRPVRRSAILNAKIGAMVTHIFVFTLLIGAISLVSIEAYRTGQSYELRTFLLIIIGLFLLELLFFAVGLLISMCTKRIDSPLPYSLGIPFGLYIVNSFESIMKNTFLKYLVPYNYYDVGGIVESHSLEAYGVVVSIVLIAVCIGASYYLYRRRNIATAT